jgi:hypothetical protein
VTVPPAPQAAAPSRAPAQATVEDAGIVPIEQLQYSGEKALRRALELQAKLEEIAGSDSTARESVDEVFDLIRLGIA